MTTSAPSSSSRDRTVFSPANIPNAESPTPLAASEELPGTASAPAEALPESAIPATSLVFAEDLFFVENSSSLNAAQENEVQENDVQENDVQGNDVQGNEAQTNSDTTEPQTGGNHSEGNADGTNPATRTDESSTSTNSIEINEYLVEPTTIPPGILNPLVTTVPFNDVALEYGAQGNVLSGVSFGDDRSSNVRYSGIISFNQQLTNSVTTGNITTLALRQNVVQIQDVLRNRILTIGIGEPVTILGQDIQLSLTGTCLEPESEEICTYTPGLATIDSSIDPELLLPTQFAQTSDFGDVVAPETLAAIQQPGFQQGTEEQQIGIDLYFPNIATLPGNSQATSTQVLRDEQFTTVPAVSYAQISQVVQGNANESALARTIRGPAIVLDTDQSIANVILASLAMFLPEVTPSISETADASNPNISRVLFEAANNTRLPIDSLTLYQAGIGHSSTPGTSEANPQDLPHATFNAIWLGLSPVIERSYATGNSFQTIGDQVLVLAAGGEGGGADAPDVTSLINEYSFSVNNIDNVYTQSYVNLYEQDALSLSTFEQTDRIRYYPHASFSGNITGPSDVFRYYGGTIFGETIQAYAGLDYQGQTEDDWFYQVGGIGFINPSYDRYSNLSGGIAKRFEFNDVNSFTLGTSFDWALDQDTQLGDIEQSGEGSDVTAQARLNLGSVSIGVTQVFGDILPNSQASRTVLDTSIRLGQDLTIAGFWAPYDAATSAPQFGVLAEVGLTIGDVNPSLIFSWENTRYEYGQDLAGNELTTIGNAFEVRLQVEW